MNNDSPGSPTVAQNNQSVDAAISATGNVSMAATSDSGGLPPLNSNNEGDFFNWFRKNNPLYLLSVVFMLLGLYLVGSELETGKISILTVTGFFAIQNLYEILMIGMALYLLKNHIQSDHGKLLLIFVMVFLGDLTFYQVRISGMHQLAGNITTFAYIALAIAKFVVVIKVLDLKIHGARIFYAFSAFALIWVGPKIAYYMVDSIGKGNIGFFDGSYFYYSLWLIAGIIHLPLIIENWRTNTLEDHEPNPYLGNATPFWRWLMVFPFIVMPVQLYFNSMSDSYSFMEKSLPLPAVIVPWAVCAAFFVQTMWRKKCEEWFGINAFDTAVMVTFLLVVMIFAPSFSLPVIINHLLAVTGLVVTWISRENHANGMALGFMAVWYAGAQLKVMASSAIKFGSGMSRTAWAALLMLGSFVLLGLGFLISINRSDKKDPENNVNEC